MKENSLISVIVPAYNVEKWLSRCLDSILNQTYKNIEIIVIDDGSKDNTKSLIDEYSHKYKNIIPIYQENQGVSYARINGIKSANGEWIGFVDSDDEIELDMYEMLLKNALKYQADISHCGYQMVFENKINYFYNTRHIVIQDNLTGLKDLLEGKFIEPGLCNKLFNKNLFKDLLDNDEIDLSIKINEDLLMNYYLFKESYLSVFEDQCKYHYIVRNNSASREKLNLNKIYDPIKVKEIIVNDKNDVIKETAKRAYLYTCINVYNSLVINKEKQFSKDKKKIRKMIVNCNNYQSLSKKHKILYVLIKYVPHMYDVIYRIYEKYFQVKRYD